MAKRISQSVRNQNQCNLLNVEKRLRSLISSPAGLLQGGAGVGITAQTQPVKTAFSNVFHDWNIIKLLGVWLSIQQRTSVRCIRTVVLSCCVFSTSNLCVWPFLIFLWILVRWTNVTVIKITGIFWWSLEILQSILRSEFLCGIISTGLATRPYFFCPANFNIKIGPGYEARAYRSGDVIYPQLWAWVQDR